MPRSSKKEALHSQAGRNPAAHPCRHRPHHCSGRSSTRQQGCASRAAIAPPGNSDLPLSRNRWGASAIPGASRGAPPAADRPSTVAAGSGRPAGAVEHAAWTRPLSQPGGPTASAPGPGPGRPPGVRLRGQGGAQGAAGGGGGRGGGAGRQWRTVRDSPSGPRLLTVPPAVRHGAGSDLEPGSPPALCPPFPLLEEVCDYILLLLMSLNAYSLWQPHNPPANEVVRCRTVSGWCVVTSLVACPGTSLPGN